nr:MAG TPA: hypothetical protein [Caudoviricetes sp.]
MIIGVLSLCLKQISSKFKRFVIVLFFYSYVHCKDKYNIMIFTTFD